MLNLEEKRAFFLIDFFNRVVAKKLAYQLNKYAGLSGLFDSVRLLAMRSMNISKSQIIEDRH